MGTGEGFDQGGFAVVDVAGGADDNGFWRGGHWGMKTMLGKRGSGVKFWEYKNRREEIGRLPVVSRGGGQLRTASEGGPYTRKRRDQDLAEEISSTICWMAARGSGAARMGRPTTRKSAPALMAWRGVAVRA